MKKWYRRRKLRRANFLFLIGAMKNGTTSLARMLNRHPKIFRGTYKESNFFAAKGSKLESENSYLDSFFSKERARVKGKWLLDASTCYTKNKNLGDVAGKIKAFTDKAKFIYLMQDPIERIGSQLGHGHRNMPNFAARFAESKHRTGFYHQHILLSSYAMHLENYEKQFPRTDILALRFDDLVGDSDVTIAKILPFLDLQPPEKLVFSQANARPPKSTDQGKQGLLPDEMRAPLQEELAPEMEKLRARWGIDVSDWGF